MTTEKIPNESIEQLFNRKLFSEQTPLLPSQNRNPIHVVYGGANLFTAETPQKLSKIALRNLHLYAPNFVEFSRAMWLSGADTLPDYDSEIKNLTEKLTENSAAVKSENFPAWFAWTIYRRTIEKLQTEAIEDFRIDFEDGYGLRTDSEEDSHAVSAAGELAKSFLENTITPFCGFRIKSFQRETYRRAVRTLQLFLTNLIEKTDGKLPENFVVTLPKITRLEEVEILDEILSRFEAEFALPKNSVGLELMIETPQAIFGDDGNLMLPKLVSAADGRVTSAHFGAFDFTSSYGIAGIHQHLRHEACDFARNLMQISLSRFNIRLSDSVTIEMPVPIHKGENLSASQIKENFRVIQTAWRKHFNNITHSLSQGFYQSWDLHPAQLVARYAAVYAFFLASADSQAVRLKGFIEKATQANLTGNTFDDAASAQGLMIFFRRALSCGALTEAEIKRLTNLSAEQINSDSFLWIIKPSAEKI